MGTRSEAVHRTSKGARPLMALQRELYRMNEGPGEERE
jgi:hypothetical protein